MLNYLTIGLAVVAILYAVMIFCFRAGFKSVVRRPKAEDGTGSVSILLPFRNEEDTIAHTLESLLGQQTKVDFEIVAIDDHSTDNSAKTIANLAACNPRLRLIEANGQGKKAALKTGIATARHNIIVTTDADCIYPSRWLDTMTATFMQNNADLLAAPVVLSPVNSWFQKFQFVDFASLVGSGIGAAGCGMPIMCNGANLMFSQLQYNKLSNPLNSKFASGDDVFLLHSMKAAHNRIVFTAQPETIATTRPTPTIGSFLRQRTRWGGKAAGYTDAASLIVAAIVAVTSVGICAGTALLPWSILPFCCIYIPKLMADTIFLSAVCKQFGNRRFLWWMPVYEFIVAFYTIWVAVAAVFSSSSTTWKTTQKAK